MVILFYMKIKLTLTFLISNFRRVLNVVCFLLGNYLNSRKQIIVRVVGKLYLT
jgi:hypothetical protein